MWPSPSFNSCLHDTFSNVYCIDTYCYLHWKLNVCIKGPAIFHQYAKSRRMKLVTNTQFVTTLGIPVTLTLLTETRVCRWRKAGDAFTTFFELIELHL